MILTGMTVIAAAAAAVSWLTVTRSGEAFPRRYSAVLAAWAATGALARAVGMIHGQAAGLVSDGLLLTASLLALVGVAGAARIGTLAGGLAPALAEAVLVSSSLVTIGWVALGAPQDYGPGIALAMGAAVIDVAVMTLILRLPASMPSIMVDGRYSRQIFLASTTVVFLASADGMHALVVLGVGVPATLISLLTVAGYVVGAVLPHVSQSPVLKRRRVTFANRAMPYVLVGAAVIAVSAQALYGNGGVLPGVLVSLVVGSLVSVQAFGLRENARLLADLEASRHRLAALVENTSDLIVRLDANGRISAVNAAAMRLLHRSPSALIGRSFDDLAHSDDRREVREAVLAVTRGRQVAAQVELRLAEPAGGTAELRLRAVPGGAVANLNDVTDAVDLRHRLERMARYDQMTGLANRTHLLERLGSWLVQPGGHVTVLYADLDGFKPVNDRFGHAAGDRVLSEVARRLESVAHGIPARSAIVGRVGGDEFVIALEGLSAGAALIGAQRVVDAIGPSFTVNDRTVQIGVSVGLSSGAGLVPDLDPDPWPELDHGSEFGPDHLHGGIHGGGTHDYTLDDFGRSDADPPSGEDAASELLHRADIAMYAAKTGGRAQVMLWNAGLEELARRRVDIAIGLRRALDTGRLALAYQPIVRLADGTMFGAEALIRLPESDGAHALVPGLEGVVSPAELVSVAEDTGSITEMGLWVLAQAAEQAAAWWEAGHDVHVSVNISVQQLLSDVFVEAVEEVLDSCGLPASRLVLEITESQLVAEAGPAVTALERLREVGVGLAIDDFGTGYSSLGYLRRMPVQVVKIDRTLLESVGVDARATALIRSVVLMARDLDLAVVAEGLEDMATVRLLRDLGAYAGQGFALSPALPPEEFTTLLGAPHSVRDWLGTGRTGRTGGAGGTGGTGETDEADGSDGDLSGDGEPVTGVVALRRVTAPRAGAWAVPEHGGVAAVMGSPAEDPPRLP